MTNTQEPAVSAPEVRYLAVASEVHKVPGSTTRDGRQGIATAVRNSLDRVRRNINRRAGDDNG